MGTLKDLRRKIALSLALGVAVVLALSIYADLPKLWQVASRFEWRLLPVIIGLTLLNYALRYVKWNYYLGQIGAGGLSHRQSALVFLSGLSMVLTPGKVGEWLKCFLLREVRGTPFATSAPILLAERLTDGIAMLLLCAGGLIVYGYGWQVMAFIWLEVAVFIAVARYRPLALRLLTWGERLPLLARYIQHFHRFYESTYQLSSAKNLLLAVGLGVISWGGECVAFYFVLVGLGLPPSPSLLLQAAFVLAASTLVGAVSMLPGGLAAAEGSIAGMLLLLGLTSSTALAAAATLLIRFCTLWFGVAVGALALLLLSRQLDLEASLESSKEDELLPEP